MGWCLFAGILLTLGTVTGAKAFAAEKAEGFRTLTDLQGNRVSIAPARDLRRVVIIAPPLVSTFASLCIPQAEIVGAHKFAFEDANKRLLDLLLPGWKKIPTGFLTGFQSNSEELLKLNPDVILVYGKFQKEGLQSVPVPVLDFFLDQSDNEVWSVTIESFMREIFAAGKGIPSLQEEWHWAKRMAAECLAKRNGPLKKGLMVMVNSGGKILVRGKDSYGDDWLKKSGLTNAVDIKGDAREVSMEQLYAWNPDILYLFRGIPASDYLKGKIPGQDWRHIRAVKTGAVYDMPKGMMNWGSPNADSPLTLLWMVRKNYPELLGDAEFKKMMRAYYSRRYGIELTQETIETILYPNGK